MQVKSYRRKASSFPQIHMFLSTLCILLPWNWELDDIYLKVNLLCFTICHNFKLQVWSMIIGFLLRCNPSLVQELGLDFVALSMEFVYWIEFNFIQPAKNSRSEILRLWCLVIKWCTTFWRSSEAYCTIASDGFFVCGIILSSVKCNQYIKYNWYNDFCDG